MNGNNIIVRLNGSLHQDQEPSIAVESQNRPNVNEQLTGVGFEYQSYIAETTSLLNGQPAESFSPDLNKLDALIRSLEVK